MKERDRILVSGLVALMLLLWLGFLVHRSPRFPGSLWGGVLGVSGAALMMVPLVHSLIKRIAPLKRAVTHRVPMRTLLSGTSMRGLSDRSLLFCIPVINLTVRSESRLPC